MRIAVLGIDLAKNVCSVVGLDEGGRIVLRRRTRRDTLIALVSKMPACIVAMEACCAPPGRAGYAARSLAKGLLGRAHQNIAVVALANKLARIAWAVLRRGESFAADRAPAAA
jgi:transposase